MSSAGDKVMRGSKLVCAVSDCVSSPETRELDAGTLLVPTVGLTPPSRDAIAQCL